MWCENQYTPVPVTLLPWKASAVFIFLWQSLKLFHYLEKIKDVFSLMLRWPENNKKKTYIEVYLFLFLRNVAMIQWLKTKNNSLIWSLPLILFFTPHRDQKSQNQQHSYQSFRQTIRNHTSKLNTCHVIIINEETSNNQKKRQIFVQTDHDHK